MLTTITVFTSVVGPTPVGPKTNTLFAIANPLVNFPIPVAIVIVGFVGFAVRETSATYAFAGGVLASIATAAGYMMHRALTQQGYDIPEFITTIQIATLTSSVWALAWLGSRPYLPTWRETGETRHASFLMSWQLAWGTLGNALLLGF